MSDTVKTFFFALVLSLVCSVILAAVSATCQPRYNENKDYERKVKTLSVFGVELPENPKRTEIDEAYQHVRETQDEKGRVTAYEYLDPATDEVSGVAVPMRGKGLWGPMTGMVALDAGLKTLRGIRFFDHQETPGLGAEIDKEWFQKQFIGKPVLNDQGQITIRVVKAGAAQAPDEIDGISGATITGNGVTEMMQREIKMFLERYRKP